MIDPATLLRGLPQVQRLLERDDVVAMMARHGRPATLAALRGALGDARAAIVAGAGGEAGDAAAIVARAGCGLAAAAPALRPVVNATGIVLHTNLGRAPLADEAVAAVAAVAGGYCNLEYDLAAGGRGSRTDLIEPLLRETTGAEAALAVNNGAAAILLALAGLAGGGEVIVSRGELVEIGGGFRIPEVIAQGGARLVEVGATNRTRAADYRAAIGPETRVLLKVHQSNFRMTGFVEETPVAELAALAREHGLVTVVDLGSGLIRAVPGGVPDIAGTLAAGADLVTCSGDKLLGGPQAGLLLGRAAAVDRLRRHPLMRAVRLDKMSLAALQATLALHRDAPERVPVAAMLAADTATLAARAGRLRGMVGRGEVVASTGHAGGGALPEERIESRALAIDPPAGADAFAAVLRGGEPAVVARIAGGRLLLDMLTVAERDLAPLAAALKAALG